MRVNHSLALAPSGSMNEPEPASRPDNLSSSVAAAARGDVAAFERLYAATSGRVFALCLRMTGDRARATELAHDAFVRAWERLGSFRGEASFETWMHRLTVNVVLAAQRSDRRRERRVAHGDAEAEAALDSAPARPSRDVPSRVDLERGIASLPAGAREVLVLHDVEGYAHDEIAQRLSLSPGTVRSQLHRARKALMKWMER